MKTQFALSLLLISVGASAQSYQHLPPHERPPGSEIFDQPQYERHQRHERIERNYPRGEPRVFDEVPQRYGERPNGSRGKVTEARRCTRSGYDRTGRPVCFNWETYGDRNARR